MEESTEVGDHVTAFGTRGMAIELAIDEPEAAAGDAALRGEEDIAVPACGVGAAEAPCRVLVARASIWAARGSPERTIAVSFFKSSSLFSSRRCATEPSEGVGVAALEVERKAPAPAAAAAEPREPA